MRIQFPAYRSLTLPLKAFGCTAVTVFSYGLPILHDLADLALVDLSLEQIAQVEHTRRSDMTQVRYHTHLLEAACSSIAPGKINRG